jgi:hypothetical protein
MAEKLTTIAAFLGFTATSYPLLTFSDREKFTVDTKRSLLKLRPDDEGNYPLGTNLFVISELLEVVSLRDWRAFELVVKHASILASVKTSAACRLFDGTNFWRWDGAAWVRVDVNGAGTIASAGTAVTGTGTNFDPAVASGDHVAVGSGTAFQLRRVTVRAAAADTALTVAEGFASNLPAGTTYRVLPAAGGWNTEEEIVDNLATFPITAGKIAAVVKLVTTDDRVTPVLSEIRFAYDVHMLSALEDVFMDSLGPLMREQIRAVGELAIAGERWEGGSTIELEQVLTDAREESGAIYDVRDVEAVYDITTDPLRKTNLATGYTPPAEGVESGGAIALADEIPAGRDIAILVRYAPFLVMWKGAPDMPNQEDGRQSRRLPLLWIAQVQGSRPRYVANPIGVVNKAEGTMLVLPRPTVANYSCVTIAAVPTGIDEARLAQEVDDFFAANPVLRSKATGETYRMQVVSAFEDATEENAPANVRMFSWNLLLHEVVSFHGQAVAGAGGAGSVPVVQAFNTRLA